jgi:hypothetical protein
LLDGKAADGISFGALAFTALGRRGGDCGSDDPVHARMDRAYSRADI